MPLLARWKGVTTLPVEASRLVVGSIMRPSAEVARLAIPVGNAEARLADLFDLSGDGADARLIFEGDLSNVHGFGSSMAGGVVEVRGNVGARVGSAMSGGSILVSGNVGPWAGAEMSGGMLRVEGNAGDHLGGGLPGSTLGMREGTILVGGSAGDGVGEAMRRGLIAVAGPIGEGAGRGMIAGSIFAFGPVGPHLATGMKRGTVALFGMLDADLEIALGPTFEPTGTFRPPVLAIYLKQLQAWGFPAPTPDPARTLRRYNGDRANGGRGEVWVAAG